MAPGDPHETSLQYWRRVVGGDLERMLKAAEYQEDAIERFMRYFTEYILPAWGDKPQNRPSTTDPESKPLPLIQPSFSMTCKSPDAAVSLNINVDGQTGRHALDEFNFRNASVDMKHDTSWVKILYQVVFGRYGAPGGPTSKDIGLCFLVKPELRRGLVLDPEPIPANVKICIAAAPQAIMEGVSCWEMIRGCISAIPNVSTAFPRLLTGALMVDGFMSRYGAEVWNLMTMVATDFADPKKASFEFCCKVPAGTSSPDFAEVFKWLTISRRITAYRHDRALLQKFFDMVHGVDSKAAEQAPGYFPILDPAAVDLHPYAERTELAGDGTAPPPKISPCSIYYSIAADAPEPRTILTLDTKYNTRTDAQIAEAIQGFIQSQGWTQSTEPYTQLVRRFFPGVPLDKLEDKLHTFVSLCHVPGGDEWALQICYNPMYYRYPRQ